MIPKATVLLLGGSTEASAISRMLGERASAVPGAIGVDLITSFAGRTRSPTVPFGSVRIGGFGGIDGLVDHLRGNRVIAVIDALHPFASVMAFHASEACARVGLPLLKVQRPPWTSGPDDRWIEVDDMGDVRRAIDRVDPRRVLLSIGRQELDPFRDIVGPTFLVRSIEPADLHGSWDATALLDRGPFTESGERTLLERERIDLLVTKNSGGTATAPKLAAAAALAIPVAVLRRPPVPDVRTVPTVGEALAWLDGVLQVSG